LGGGAAQVASALILLVPAIAGLLLLALATRGWLELRIAPAPAATPQSTASIK
jgi:hypothetical protein